MKELLTIKMFDRVFLLLGKQVFSRDYINELRELALVSDDLSFFLPQVGFQEEVCLNDADILIIGGKRGGGKTFVMELAPLRFMDNPLFTVHGFRKEEADIKRGLWNTSLKIYSKLAEKKESTFSWVFPSGAKSIYEHLQNENEVDRRFRGVEMPFIIIDELPQISFKTFFTLLASNRNTVGIKNQFIASCNPVGPRHWLHQFIKWYIDEDNHDIIPSLLPEMEVTSKYTGIFSKSLSELRVGDSSWSINGPRRYPWGGNDKVIVHRAIPRNPLPGSKYFFGDNTVKFRLYSYYTFNCGVNVYTYGVDGVLVTIPDGFNEACDNYYRDGNSDNNQDNAIRIYNYLISEGAIQVVGGLSCKSTSPHFDVVNGKVVCVKAPDVSFLMRRAVWSKGEIIGELLNKTRYRIECRRKITRSYVDETGRRVIVRRFHISNGCKSNPFFLACRGRYGKVSIFTIRLLLTHRHPSGMWRLKHG